jgi:hypothetical protein
MLPQRNVKRLIYPTALIDREVARLQRDLRRLYRRYRRHELNRLQCLTDGEALIKSAFAKGEANVKLFLLKHDVIYEGNRAELEASLQSTLDSWRRIIGAFES